MDKGLFMLNFNTRLSLVVIVSLLSLGACKAGDAGKTDAKTGITVNGTLIPQARFDALLNERVAAGQPDSPELRKGIRDFLISSELLVQEAIKKGLDKDAEVASQIENTKHAVLANAYLQNAFKAEPITDDALKAEYDKLKAHFGDKEYKTRHILVGTEQEAKDILASIKNGGKFDKLAREKSNDPGSKEKGGDLGWISRGNVVKPFGDALAALEKGRYTEQPVQSRFGWHLIQLEDTRALTPPPYEEVKNGLQQRLTQQRIEKLMADLRANAKIDPPDEVPADVPAPADKAATE
ncbi:MAG: peptidylprolyl isomerase [Burkholderiales bacterium]